MASFQSFRGLIFADAGDRAHYTLYNRTYFAGLIFADNRLSAKTTKISRYTVSHYRSKLKTMGSGNMSSQMIYKKVNMNLLTILKQIFLLSIAACNDMVNIHVTVYVCTCFHHAL
jgi:hypothetical protein